MQHYCYGDSRRNTRSCFGRRDDNCWKLSSSSNLLIRVVRAYPLIEIRQTAPCRAVRGNGISVNSTLPPSYRCLLLLVPIIIDSISVISSPAIQQTFSIIVIVSSISYYFSSPTIITLFT